MFKSTTALGAMAALALAFPLTADAAKKAPVFKATVTGSQVATWSQNHVPEYACDASVQGAGSQMVRFETDPVKLAVFKPAGALPILAAASDPGARYGAPAPVPAIAKADREGYQNIQAPGGECNGTGGWNGEAPAPDCGSRFGRLDLMIGYGAELDVPLAQQNTRDVLTVTGAYSTFGQSQDSLDPATFVGDPLGHTFENCPYWADGPASPAVDELVTAGEKYPVAKLARVKKGKTVTISGDARVPAASGDFSGETLTTWNLKLKRVK